MSSGRKIKLKSADGKLFEVDLEVALQFQTIKLMFEDGCANDEIPIPNVRGRILAKVIDYCKKHVDCADQNDIKVVKELAAWDRKFVKVRQSTLFQVIMAADYLNITSLMDLTCQTVANIIEKKTPEEIRSYFDIENDYTPDEEKELRKEIDKPLDV